MRYFNTLGQSRSPKKGRLWPHDNNKKGEKNMNGKEKESLIDQVAGEAAAEAKAAAEAEGMVVGESCFDRDYDAEADGEAEKRLEAIAKDPLLNCIMEIIDADEIEMNKIYFALLETVDALDKKVEELESRIVDQQTQLEKYHNELMDWRSR